MHWVGFPRVRIPLFMGSEQAAACVAMKNVQGTALHKQSTGKMVMLTPLLVLSSTWTPSAIDSHQQPFPPGMDEIQCPCPTDPAQGHQKLDRSSAGTEMGSTGFGLGISQVTIPFTAPVPTG